MDGKETFRSDAYMKSDVNMLPPRSWSLKTDQYWDSIPCSRIRVALSWFFDDLLTVIGTSSNPLDLHKMCWDGTVL